jgi:hypothetical protein
MKKLSFITLALVAVIFGVNNTGCSGTETPDPVDTLPGDTTPVEVIVNEFKIGFDTYKLNIEEDLTYGVYNSASDRTYIYVSGNDGSNGDADFAIEFDGNVAGTFTNTPPETATFACGTGTVGDIRREEFTADGGTISITVTEYGDELTGVIKGTFTGTVMKGVNSYQVRNGKFEVKRKLDE